MYNLRNDAAANRNAHQLRHSFFGFVLFNFHGRRALSARYAVSCSHLVGREDPLWLSNKTPVTSIRETEPRTLELHPARPKARVLCDIPVLIMRTFIRQRAP